MVAVQLDILKLIATVRTKNKRVFLSDNTLVNINGYGCIGITRKSLVLFLPSCVEENDNAGLFPMHSCVHITDFLPTSVWIL